MGCGCYVVITFWSAIWTLLTIILTLSTLYSLTSSEWLISHPKPLNHNETKYLTQPHSIGLYKHCVNRDVRRGTEKLDAAISLLPDSTLSCTVFAHNLGRSDHIFPIAWQVGLFLAGMGSLILSFTMLTSIASMCRRDMCGKSIFTITGLIQVIAGFLFTISTVSYPLGWKSSKVKYFCGVNTDYFKLDHCSLGWSYYVMIACSALLLIVGLLSIKADKATNKPEIEDYVKDGQTLICV